MRDHDAACMKLGFGRGEFARDVVVAQPVEAVAAHALFVEPARECESVVHEGVVAVKGGVEAGDLRRVREGVERGAHARKVMRLMERRERREFGEFGHQVVGDALGRGMVDAAMHDPVPDRDHLEPRKARVKGGQRGGEGLGMGLEILRAGVGDRQCLPGPIDHAQPPLPADPVDMAEAQRLERLGEQPELERGRPRVERQDRAHQPLRTRFWWIAATAAEARRAMALSERELRITGTRAPSTSPAPSAWLI